MTVVRDDACASAESSSQHTIAESHDALAFIVLPHDVNLIFRMQTVKTLHFGPLQSIDVNFQRVSETGRGVWRRSGQICNRALLYREILISNRAIASAQHLAVLCFAARDFDDVAEKLDWRRERRGPCIALN